MYKMPDEIPLRKDVIYGPVDSRRLGNSLGINLSPIGFKSCSFDCVYCQYGPTDVAQMSYGPEVVPGIEEVEGALQRRLVKLWEQGKEPDYITFSGNGEPTLHPYFEQVARRVKETRDSYSPGSKIALLSNSSRVTDPEIMDVIRGGIIDCPIMKLDVGTESKFMEVNRPAYSCSDYWEIIECLKGIDSYVIQSIKFRGEVNNFDKDIEQWMDIIEELDPDAVQLYSLDRPTRRELEEVRKEELDQVGEELGERGVEVEVF